MLNKTNLLGVGITTESNRNILEYVLRALKSDKKFFIVTPNPEILVYANKHESYKKALNDAQIALSDGVGLLIAGKMLGKPLKERFTGVDFIEKLCSESKDQPVSMGFLGGRSKVAERAAECLLEKYPWIEIVFASDEWDEAGFSFGDYLETTQSRTVSHHKTEDGLHISQSSGKSSDQQYSGQKSLTKNASIGLIKRQIDILFVAYGFPKQEEWIINNLEKLPIKAAMGVGGAFDYLSGEVVRAPSFIRSLGLEWLFRLIRQPWRWKRQLALLEFIWLVIKEKVGSNK